MDLGFNLLLHTLIGGTVVGQGGGNPRDRYLLVAGGNLLVAGRDLLVAVGVDTMQGGGNMVAIGGDLLVGRCWNLLAPSLGWGVVPDVYRLEGREGHRGRDVAVVEHDS